MQTSTKGRLHVISLCLFPLSSHYWQLEWDRIPGRRQRPLTRQCNHQDNSRCSSVWSSHTYVFIFIIYFTAVGLHQDKSGCRSVSKDTKTTTMTTHSLTRSAATLDAVVSQAHTGMFSFFLILLPSNTRSSCGFTLCLPTSKIPQLQDEIKTKLVNMICLVTCKRRKSDVCTWYHCFGFSFVKSPFTIRRPGRRQSLFTTITTGKDNHHDC